MVCRNTKSWIIWWWPQYLNTYLALYTTLIRDQKIQPPRHSTKLTCLPFIQLQEPNIQHVRLCFLGRKGMYPTVRGTAPKREAICYALHLFNQEHPIFVTARVKRVGFMSACQERNGLISYFPKSNSHARWHKPQNVEHSQRGSGYDRSWRGEFGRAYVFVFRQSYCVLLCEYLWTALSTHNQLVKWGCGKRPPGHQRSSLRASNSASTVQPLNWKGKYTFFRTPLRTVRYRTTLHVLSAVNRVKRRPERQFRPMVVATYNSNNEIRRGFFIYGKYI